MSGRRAIAGEGVQFFGKDGEILPYGLPTFNREVNAKMPQSSHEITKAEHFKIFRDYMQHEDNLINQRVSWNSTIQGFLFATYGLSQQKLPDPKPGPGALHNLETLVRTIPWFGFGLSILVFLAVLAATLAHRRLADDWRVRVSPCYPDKQYLPDIAAGGVKAAGWLGFGAPVLIPIFFAVAWLYIII